MISKLLPIEAQLSHRVLDNSMLHRSLPEYCNKHNIHEQLYKGHWDINFPAFCSTVEASKQLSLLGIWTYFICNDHNTSVHCKTDLCNFILYLIQTDHSQRNSIASEVVSPQFELWTFEQWSSDATKTNKSRFTVLTPKI